MRNSESANKKTKADGKRFVSANSLITQESVSGFSELFATMVEKEESKPEEAADGSIEKGEREKKQQGRNMKAQLFSKKKTRPINQSQKRCSNHGLFENDLLREIFDEEDDDDKCSSVSISRNDKKYSTYYEFAIDLLHSAIADISDDEDDDDCSVGEIRLSQ
mmetsp:Transcript_4011/g.5773  ORF Transcript_4011/g.5773 Transcript_4011/m.5773 type:complete len:163 (-) Transcript_4011:64-552(-)